MFYGLRCDRNSANFNEGGSGRIDNHENCTRYLIHLVGFSVPGPFGLETHVDDTIIGAPLSV